MSLSATASREEIDKFMFLVAVAYGHALDVCVTEEWNNALHPDELLGMVHFEVVHCSIEQAMVMGIFKETFNNFGKKLVLVN